ncbi:hypothetical protein Q5692_33685 [Microcoleus sp. C2C3]|uniref:hypothetical protein n=1 Tax=unclassified Microcoleus TaxID=2642155 RepID=UPI002FD17E55
MDIMALAKELEKLLCLPSAGDKEFSLWRRREEVLRQVSRNSWRFWKDVCRLIRGQIRVLLNSSFSTSLFAALLLEDLLVYAFVYAFLDNEVDPSKVKQSKPEVGRAPPKRFIPLPDAEIGGYARNDSLTAPAIN